MRKCSLLVSALFLIIPGASAFGQTVRVNWHVHAPFGDYHTYAWKDTKDKGPAFYTQWVRKDVDSEMASKGLRQAAANQKPEVLLKKSSSGGNECMGVLLSGSSYML